jgi:hypothetical protein
VLQNGNPLDDRLAIAYAMVGNIEKQNGRADAARQAWQAALTLWPRDIRETPRQMAIRAELLTSLGRSQESKPLRERLTAMGYRVLI